MSRQMSPLTQPIPDCGGGSSSCCPRELDLFFGVELGSFGSELLAVKFGEVVAQGAFDKAADVARPVAGDGLVYGVYEVRVEGDRYTRPAPHG